MESCHPSDRELQAIFECQVHFPIYLLGIYNLAVTVMSIIKEAFLHVAVYVFCNTQHIDAEAE